MTNTKDNIFSIILGLKNKSFDMVDLTTPYVNHVFEGDDISRLEVCEEYGGLWVKIDDVAMMFASEDGSYGELEFKRTDKYIALIWGDFKLYCYYR